MQAFILGKKKSKTQMMSWKNMKTSQLHKLSTIYKQFMQLFTWDSGFYSENIGMQIFLLLINGAINIYVYGMIV